MLDILNDSATTTFRPRRWLMLAAICLVPIFFHGCHLGGHDEDLLCARLTSMVPRVFVEMAP